MTRHIYKLVGQYRLPAAARMYYKVGGAAWTYFEIGSGGPISAGLYGGYGDDQSDDIAFQIAESCPITVTFGFSSATGVWTVQNSTGSAVELSFYANGTTLRPESSALNDMVFRSTALKQTFAIGETKTFGPQTYSFYPNKLIVEDIGSNKFASRQSVSVNGRVRTVKIGERLERTLKVRMTNAWPRSLVQNEYHQFVAFLREASSGRPFRYYPDVSVQTAYTEVTNPYGYHTLVASAESCDFTPQPEHGNRYNQFLHELKCYEPV